MNKLTVRSLNWSQHILISKIYCPMMSKKGKLDHEYIVTNFKRIWPDYTITIQNLRQPTTQLFTDILEKFFTTIDVDYYVEMRKVTADTEIFADIVKARVYINILNSLLFNIKTQLVDKLKLGVIFCPTVQVTQMLLMFFIQYLFYNYNFKKKLMEKISKIKNRAITNEQLFKLTEDLNKCKNQFAIKCSEAQIIKAEVDKNSHELKRTLKKNGEKKQRINKIFITLEEQHEISAEELNTKLKLDKDLKLRQEYINVTSKYEEGLKESNSLDEEYKSMTQTRKIKIGYQIDLNNKLDTELFSITNDRLIDGTKNREKHQLEIKALKKKLNYPFEDILNKIKSVESDIETKEKKCAVLEEEQKNRQMAAEENQEKIKSDIKKIDLQITTMENLKINKQLEVEKLRKEMADLMESEEKFDAVCQKTYQKILNQAKATQEKFCKVLQDAQNLMER